MLQGRRHDIGLFQKHRFGMALGPAVKASVGELLPRPQARHRVISVEQIWSGIGSCSQGNSRRADAKAAVMMARYYNDTGLR